MYFLLLCLFHQLDAGLDMDAVREHVNRLYFFQLISPVTEDAQVSRQGRAVTADIYYAVRLHFKNRVQAY